MQIKDLVVGSQLAQVITDHAAYKELRPGQITVPEGELVESVRRTLEAQAEERVRV